MATGRTRSKKAGKGRETDTDAAEPSLAELNEERNQQHAAVMAQLTRQNDLLEVIALSTARMAELAEEQNRLAGEARRVADTHGLSKRIKQLLDRDTITRTLAGSTDGPDNDEANSGTTDVHDTG